MRVLAREIAFDPHAWGPGRQDEIARLFDALAPTWPTLDEIGVLAPLQDALDRGVTAAPSARRQRALDLGGGNGRATHILAERFAHTVILDLSGQMLVRVPQGLAMKVQADAAHMPVHDGTFDVVVCTNMFLFPGETARVLADDGVVVWVNSWGAATPIHLDAREVDRALPGEWSGVASGSGEATWSVHWRT